MHLPLLKALVVVISASVVAIGAALAPTAHNPQHADGSAATTRTRTFESDGLEFPGNSPRETSSRMRASSRAGPTM
jgi:hypothetical protein